MDAKLRELVIRKEEMEKEIMVLNKQVDQLEKAEGFDKPLVDREGFPRQDLDYGRLQEYKLQKKRLSELRNDHLNLMKEVESGLFELHQHYRESGVADQDIQEYEKKIPERKAEEAKNEEIPLGTNVATPKKANPLMKEIIYLPFAKVSELMEGSPAVKAGLRLDDFLCKFGFVTEKNHNNLNELATEVRDNIERDIDVLVLRKVDPARESEDVVNLTTYKNEPYESVKIKLRPQKWSGAGYLGCRFVRL